MTIVAAVGNSDKASKIVEDGNSLAKAFGEPLHVVHVMSESEYISRQQEQMKEKGSPLDNDDVKQIAANVAKETAQDVTVEFKAIGLVGKVAGKISVYAEKHDARYIVIGRRKRSPTGKAIFGSKTQDILLNAHNPVITIV